MNAHDITHDDESGEVTIYLSRARLTAKGRSWLVDNSGEGIYPLHQLFWKLFDRPDGSRCPFLFTPPEKGVCYLQSAFQPVSNDLVEVETVEKTPQMPDGVAVHVRAWLNATVCTRAEPFTGGSGSKRVGLEHYERVWAEIDGREEKPLDELYADWMARQGKRHGFEVEALTTLSGTHTLQGVKHGSKISLDVVHVQARLRVTDAEAFLECWQQGLGRGKSLGAGMLMVKPAPTVELL